MGLALIVTLVGAAGLVLACLSVDVGGGWGWLIAAPVALASLTMLAPAVRVLSIGARTIARRRGDTVLRLPRLLSERDERELYRRVDLLRGRLRQTVHGLDDGVCEVWALRRPCDVRAIRRAWRIGVGRLGRAVCPVLLEDALDPDRARPALALALARNAAAAMTRSRCGFLTEGLVGYLATCALHAEGPALRTALHQPAADALRGETPELTAQLRPRASAARSGSGAVGTSFTAFLIGRYGLASYLRMLNHADRNSAEVALLLAYGRSAVELERRWRLFLGSNEPARAHRASA